MWCVFDIERDVHTSAKLCALITKSRSYSRSRSAESVYYNFVVSLGWLKLSIVSFYCFCGFIQTQSSYNYLQVGAAEILELGLEQMKIVTRSAEAGWCWSNNCI